MPDAEDQAAAALHVLGLLLAAVLGAGLLRLAERSAAGPARRRAVLVFVAAWLALYIASVAFHLAPAGGARRLLAAFDQGAIFILVAAGWAPLAPFRLPPGPASRLLWIVWGLAAVGLAGEVAAALAGQRGWLHGAVFALYLAQGLAPILVSGRSILTRLSRASLGFLFSSVLVYAVGVVFYRRPEMPWNHVIWHAAIVLGCLLNFAGVRRLLREDARSTAAAGRP